MHFLEIIRTSIISDKRLVLPNEFTMKYGKELSDHAIIKVPNGIWHIVISKAEGELVFENGWPEFMEFYSIRVGHLIVFRYDGNSKFQVHIFGMDTTEIDYYPSHMDNAKHEVEVVSSYSDEVEVVLPSKKRRKVEVISVHSDSTQSYSLSSESTLRSNYEPSMFAESATQSNNEPSLRECPDKTPVQKTIAPKRFHTEAFRATLEAAEAFKPENPFFKRIIQDSHIKKGVKVPVAFANSYLRNITRMMITLRISDGRTWEVGYISRTVQIERTESMIYKGWYKFVADNHLKAGNVCVFELVDRKKIKINVHIFRQQTTYSRKLTPKSSYYTDEFQATLEAAEEFTSENPFFKIVMHASHIKSGILSVPAVFATSHLRNVTRMTITLKVDEKTWEVGYLSTTPTERKIARGLIYRGWRVFVADNDLNEGDVCVFELVDHRKKFEMNVHIFRLLQDMV
ncbi:hypothetical protein MKW94_007698 [Papaver nudicaule]|uniref:TF-B3 domain-containing protein n=1 Tax=Papaver nudicaule TaxID=74823 RepID=A0AA42B1S9_PAPNU|nr:hypothetical protein [Papaver nudicaule]